jgi:Zn-dependent protease with chaperone function
MQNAPPQADVVQVDRWPAETILLAFVIMASAFIWLMLALSIIGIVYALLIALFLFLTHLGFVAHVRGSAARIGPDQFPELHARLQELSRRAGLPKAPAAYVLQAGGSLNALATKFFRARMVVIFSDLLDACGDDDAARDMILGHELGHVRARHLDGLWFLLPGMIVPFLGSAYSRARERTCDRYGAALCGDRRGAVRGLAILAAGGSRGREINASAFVRQREDLDTGWMTLARWLAAYPPLCDRVAAVDSSLASPAPSLRGPMRAVGILAALAAIPAALTIVVLARLAPAFTAAMREVRQRQTASGFPATSTAPVGGPAGEPASVRLRVHSDLDRLAEIAKQFHTAHGRFPKNEKELYGEWRSRKPYEPAPLDPCDGKRYGYSRDGEAYVLWSAGLDGKEETDDDIVFNLGHGSPGAGGR